MTSFSFDFVIVHAWAIGLFFVAVISSALSGPFIKTGFSDYCHRQLSNSSKYACKDLTYPATDRRGNDQIALRFLDFTHEFKALRIIKASKSLFSAHALISAFISFSFNASFGIHSEVVRGVLGGRR